MKQKLRPMEVFMNAVFFLCGFIAVVFVLFISVYLILSGLPAIREIGLVEFLFGTKWASTAAEPSFGILPFILTSVYGTAGAIVLGVPVGFMTAVFLAKIAPAKLSTAVRSAVDLLAGMPSVGDGYEFDAITAVVVGGTSFLGGIGTVTGALVGSIIIGLINNILNLLHVSTQYQLIVKGVLIAVAVIIDIKTKENKKSQ